MYEYREKIGATRIYERSDLPLYSIFRICKPGGQLDTLQVTYAHNAAFKSTNRNPVYTISVHDLVAALEDHGLEITNKKIIRDYTPTPTCAVSEKP